MSYNRQRISLLLSQIQDYYGNEGLTKHFPASNEELKILEREINIGGNALGDSNFIKLFSEEESPIQIFYDYRTGESIQSFKNVDSNGNISYEIIPKTDLKIDIYKDIVSYNPALVLQILTYELVHIKDTGLVQMIKNEIRVINAHLREAKKLVKALENEE